MKSLLILLALSGSVVAGEGDVQKGVNSAAFPADIGLTEDDGFGYRVRKKTIADATGPSAVAPGPDKVIPPPSDKTGGDPGIKPTSKPAPTPATETAPKGAPVDPANLDESAPAIVHAYAALRDAGLRPGYDPEAKRHVIVGQAPIAAEPSQANFGVMREAAFQAAMLDATRSYAEFLGVELAIEIESRLTSPPESNTVSPDATEREARRLSALAFERSEEFLKNRHAQQGSGAASAPGPMTAEEAKEFTALVLNSNEMKDAIQVAAAAEVASIQVWKAFEDSGNDRKGSVAVICISSKGSRAMVDAMLGKGSPPETAPRLKLGSWLDSLTPEQLMYSHGVLMRRDEYGALNLIAFGQSTARSETSVDVDIAMRNADLNALQALRGFKGLAVTSDASRSRQWTVESIKTEAGAIRERSTDSMRMRSYISAIGEKTTITGAMPVRHWRAVHPANLGTDSARTTFGVIYQWSPASQHGAAALLEASSKLGAAQPDKASEEETGKKDAKSPSKKKSGAGVQGDID